MFDLGSVTLTGVAPFPVPGGQNEGSVIVDGNTLGGVQIQNCATTTEVYTPTNAGPAAPGTTTTCSATFGNTNIAPPQSILDGIAIWNHTLNNGNGLVVIAGNRLKLRNSVILANARSGVRINNGPSVNVVNGAPPPANWTYTVFDLSVIDLGTAANPGHNILQVGFGSASNLGAGLQINISATQNQIAKAAGNSFQANANPVQVFDCSSGTVGAVSRNFPSVTTCAAGNPSGGVSVCGNITAGAGANSIDVSGCSVP